MLRLLAAEPGTPTEPHLLMQAPTAALTAAPTSASLVTPMLPAGHTLQISRPTEALAAIPPKLPADDVPPVAASTQVPTEAAAPAPTGSITEASPKEPAAVPASGAATISASCYIWIDAQFGTFNAVSNISMIQLVMAPCWGRAFKTNLFSSESH